MKDLKYLLSYLIPISAIVAITLGGVWSFLTFIIGFVVFPIMELFFTGTDENLTKEDEKDYKANRFFDYVVYLNVPLQYGVVFYFLYTVSTVTMPIIDLIGMTISVGMCCGVIGINVAHELGHRRKKSEQWMSKALLLTSLYMHFFIEHNRGHHKNVATDLDPASSRLNEPIYAFWVRSIFGAYKSAWHLENKRLSERNQSVYTWENEMVRFHVIEFVFTLAIFLVFGPLAGVCFIGAAMGGYLLLESVNYIEHYGLRRKELAPGRYEKCMPWHSWNSDHTLGRIFLYDLTRHSDHHYLASRKYQVLRHFNEAPQLPTGYPGSIVVALFPPLWFKLMNPLVEELNDHGKREGVEATLNINRTAAA